MASAPKISRLSETARPVMGPFTARYSSYLHICFRHSIVAVTQNHSLEPAAVRKRFLASILVRLRFEETPGSLNYGTIVAGLRELSAQIGYTLLRDAP